MELKNFNCVSKNHNIDEYLEFYNEVRNNMEHPEWLGTFTKEEIEKLLSIGGKLFNYYDDNVLVCSFFYLPCSNKSLQKHNINYDETIVGSCGPIMVNKKYIGNGLQSQMIEELDNYCRSINKKYCYTFNYNYYLNPKLQVWLKYLRNWVKNAESNANSSGDLSFAILHAKIEINVTNSQFMI